MKCINLIGERFGRLVVQTSVGKNPNGRYLWLCLCDCGNFWTVLGHNLKNGHTKSCGCLSAELASVRNRTHGQNRRGLTTRTYSVWRGMMQRCYYKKHKGYKYWGGRGIKVCERWHKFENFFADVGDIPEGLTLDRKDNEGDYEPGNWRFATVQEQSNNRRSNHWLTQKDVTKNITQWAKELGINPKTLGNRVYNGWSEERALSTPSKDKK